MDDHMPECDCVFCDACLALGFLPTTKQPCPVCDGSGIVKMCAECQEEEKRDA